MAPLRLALRRLLAIVVGLVAGAGVVEGAARVAARAEGGRWSAALHRRHVRDVRAVLTPREWSAAAGDAAQGRILHPYVGYLERGQLRAWPTGDIDAPTFELAIVGGSVSCLLVHQSGERLARALAAHPSLAGRRVRVHALGQGGLKQPQQAMAVEWAFATGARFDAIVNIDGFNEVAMGWQNAAEYGAPPLYPTYSVWAHLSGASASAHGERALFELLRAQGSAVRWCDRALRPGVLASAFVGRLVLRRVEGATQAAIARADAYVKALAAPATEAGGDMARLDDVLDAIAECWVQASVSTAASCERRGVRYLHVLQPTLLDVDTKPLTPEERRVGVAGPAWSDAVRGGYPRLRAAAHRLVELHVEFLDASRAFEHDSRELYYDCCHVRAEGTDVLADAIAERLAGSL